MSLSTTKKNLQLSTIVRNNGGILIGGLNGYVSLRGGKMVKKMNKYGKTIIKKKNSSRRSYG
tara:strand:- start:40 stop:225 length:186 start_codon:yes stop_codon:yes gene_type:complete